MQFFIRIFQGSMQINTFASSGGCALWNDNQADSLKQWDIEWYKNNKNTVVNCNYLYDD